MKKLIFTIILFISSLAYGFACLNSDTKKLKNNLELFSDLQNGVPNGHYLRSFYEIESVLQELDSLYKETKDIDYLSDKGLLFIFNKQFDKAIKLYLFIEKIKPNRYSTASNIGTAYELIGDNINALKWIKKSIQINSKSHFSSEWIHERILEAKVNGDSFINSKFLINIDFKNGIIPTTNLSKKELNQLHAALFFQLNERITFVKPKEKIVAKLLFELGNIDFILENISPAYQNYALAKKYGFTDIIIDNRMKKLINKATPKIYTEKVGESKRSGLTYYLIDGVSILILVLGYFFRKKLLK